MSKLGIYVIFDKGKRRGLDLRFQRCDWAIYRSLRKSEAYEAGQYLLGNSETMGHIVSS